MAAGKRNLRRWSVAAIVRATAVGAVFLFGFTDARAAGDQVDEIALVTSEGQPFVAYAAGPEDATTGILVAHDWFGITPFALESLKTLGAEGYRAVAVDLYAGESAETHKKAFRLMQALDKDEALAKLTAALALVSGPERKTVTFGFSMGSPFALEVALQNSAVVSANVTWYGETPSDTAQLEGFGGELLAVYGSLDGDAAAQAAALSRAADGAKVKAQVFIYPQAHHAFAQPLFNAGETYDPAAARAAWAVTKHFLGAIDKAL